jgi:hypothetical protein
MSMYLRRQAVDVQQRIELFQGRDPPLELLSVGVVHRRHLGLCGCRAQAIKELGGSTQAETRGQRRAHLGRFARHRLDGGGDVDRVQYAVDDGVVH